MKKTNQYFRKYIFGLERWKKRLLQITSDVLIAAISLLLAFFMRLETTDYLFRIDTHIAILIAVVTTFTVFAAQGLYSNITRHISSETAYNIGIGSVLSQPFCFLEHFYLSSRCSFSSSNPWTLGAFATAIRLFIRDWPKYKTENQENVAIYGADTAGIQVMDSLRKT